MDDLHVKISPTHDRNGCVQASLDHALEPMDEMSAIRDRAYCILGFVTGS
jgi:hypothetical protein